MTQDNHMTRYCAERMASADVRVVNNLPANVFYIMLVA